MASKTGWLPVVVLLIGSVAVATPETLKLTRGMEFASPAEIARTEVSPRIATRYSQISLDPYLYIEQA